jgi:hypothetical protein
MSKNKNIIIGKHEFTPEFVKEAKKLRLWSKIQRNTAAQIDIVNLSPIQIIFRATTPEEVLTALSSLFIWDQTPEGHEWWKNKSK